MLTVNLYGAPGAGKSTGAAYIFSQLKMRGVNAELVTEFANDPVLGEEFDRLVTKVAKSYDSLNVFINRTKPYNGAGRFQTEAESDELSCELHEFLVAHDVACQRYNGDKAGYDTLVADILERLNSGKVVE